MLRAASNNLAWFTLTSIINPIRMSKLSWTMHDDLTSPGFNSCRSLLYPDGSPLTKDIAAKRLPATVEAFARISSSVSGFFFCGIRLELEEYLSGISTKPNSVVLHKMKSSAILDRFNIIMLSDDMNSIKSSLDVVASIELFRTPLNPSKDAVLFLSILILVPPIAHAPRGDIFILL